MVPIVLLSRLLLAPAPRPAPGRMVRGMALWAMLLPALAQAVVLGELVVESRIGEAFRGYVPLAATENDEINASCFSLGVHGEDEADSRHYLVAARLTVEGESNAARRVVIRGANTVHEPFLRLALQAKCGAERASRKYTVLLDPPRATPAAAPPPPPAAALTAEAAVPHPGIAWEMRRGDTVFGLAKAIYPRNAGMRSRLVAEIVRRNPEAFPAGDPGRITAGATLLIPDLRQLSAPIAVAATAVQPRVSVPAERQAPPSKAMHELKSVAKAEEPPPPPASMQRIPMAEFRLKLSGSDLNLSLIGKLTEEQRSFLRERQFLLDADDQTAGFLALKHRVSELEKQLESMRLKMSRTVSAPAPAPPRPQALSATTPFGSEVWQIARYGLTLYLLPFSQIVVAMLALFFIIRHYSSIKERLAARGLLRKGAKPRRRAVVMEPEKGAPPITEFDQRLVIAATPSAAAASPVALDSVDAILEEAQLYVIHGHPDHAIRLLEEQIRGNRGEVRIWMLLFVIYRSQGMKLEFEKLANRFRNAIRDEELWENIQTLGHELDPENDFYLNDRIRAQRAMASSPGALDFTLEGVSAEEAEQAPALDLDLGARSHEAAAGRHHDIDFDIAGEPGAPHKPG